MGTRSEHKLPFILILLNYTISYYYYGLMQLFSQHFFTTRQQQFHSFTDTLFIFQLIFLSSHLCALILRYHYSFMRFMRDLNYYSYIFVTVIMPCEVNQLPAKLSKICIHLGLFFYNIRIRVLSFLFSFKSRCNKGFYIILFFILMMLIVMYMKRRHTGIVIVLYLSIP